MSKFNSSEFLIELQNNMENLLTNDFNDVNKSVNIFLKTYNEVVDKHAPLRKISKKQQKIKRKPYINSEILNCIKTKNKLLKTHIKFRTPQSHENYKKIRNKLNHMIDKAKKTYYCNLFQTAQLDSRTLWKNIDKIIKFKQPKHNKISRIEQQDNVIKDPKIICEKFNDYFVNVGINLSKELPINNTSTNPEDLIKNNKDSLFLVPITNIEILNMIKQLDPNKSTPSLCPSNKIIKISAPVISPILTAIFNLCLLKGIFPDQFKTSEVIPIYKSGSKFTMSNHRPIAILSPFSKLLEKCIYTRVNKFLNHNKLLYDSQFGFRNNASTENAVLQLYNQLLEKLSNNQISCSIFIDLKKAFDTVDHSILIRKLRRYGVRGIPLKLLESYLTDRLQYTLINNYSSQSKTIRCGVPQGSTLGPLLFLIYVNDLYLASKFDLNLFADDAYLAMSNTSSGQLEIDVNNELVKIHNWLNINKLSLNIKKTKFIIFKNTRKNNLYKFNIKFGSQTIEQTEEIKYLGVIIDSNLNWKPHIKFIKNKVSSGCWVLFKLKKKLK